MWTTTLLPRGKLLQFLQVLRACACAVRVSLTQHSLSVFVRLVRALLGPSAIADAKTGFGLNLVILGILVASAA
jgi:hypothetical protein